MPSTSSDERLHSHDIVVDLLSEARHLVVRDRAGEEDNLLQIQQAIEAAQRELRRLHFRSSVEEFRAIAAQAGLREEVGEVEQSSQEHYGTEESSDVVDGYTDDEGDGVALVTQTQNGTTASERVLGENGVENNLGSDEEARTTDEEEGSVDLTRPDIEDADPRSPSLGLSSFGPSGSTLIYTDLSRLQQTRSFIDFIDRRVGRATSSNLSDPGNILDQTPRDGDTRTIMHALRPGEEWQVTESENDPSGGSPYILSRAVTPLPTPPRSPTAISQRESTSIGSTGATAGSSVVPENRKDDGRRENQSPFTKERRVQLMVAMATDIARYSQEREWALYQEQGYCIFPSVESPVPESETKANRDPTGPSGNGEGSSTAVRTLRRYRRERNRATLPMQLFEQRPVNGLPDPAEDFLVYLLTETQTIRGLGPIRQEEEGPRFEELRLPLETARFRYSLVRQAMDGTPTETDKIAFEDSIDLLRREDSSRGTNGARIETAASVILLAAQRDGMDIREATRFAIEWTQWTNSSSRWALYPDIGGFISVSDMQFWTALRRGWGNWRPSQRMLDEVRRVLQTETIFAYTPSISRLGITSEDFNLTTESWILERVLTLGERSTLLRLQEDGVSGLRVLLLERNWHFFIINGQHDLTRLPSESHFSTRQLILDRLERLIRQERVINARRRMRGPDGEWIE